MKKSFLKTPVLFLVFNRPEKTLAVFESIKKVRPQKLYIAIDAPREGREDDIINNDAVKKIIHQVDWECETHYLEQEKNLGCSLSGVTAWNWLFEHEDRMIFVEDDGLANSSAFFFVEDMLEKYKEDSRIAYVGAVNYGYKYGEDSYFFTRFVPATYFMGVWKRTQQKYEYDLQSYNAIKRTKQFRDNFRSLKEYLIMKSGFDSYINSIKYGHRQNTYDIQMNYLVYKEDMFSIYPNINMVSNIGLDGGANNSVDTDSDFYKEYGNRPKEEMDAIKYKEDFYVDNEFDMKMFNYRCLHGNNWIITLIKSYGLIRIKSLLSFFK